MNAMTLTELYFLLSFTLVCCTHDLMDGKIPNSFIVTGLMCALSSKLFLSWRLTVSCLPGFLIPYLLLGLFVLAGMIGGGDVKLMSVIGLFAGPSAILKIMLYSLEAVALASILILIRKKNALIRFRYFFEYLSLLLTAFKARGDPDSPPRIPSYRGTGTADGEFCFSTAIFFGLIIFTIKELML